MSSRYIINGLSGALATLALLLLLRLVSPPDPVQSLFARAQSLENAGQVARALRAYELISQKHPESFYASRALFRQGDLLAAQGRSTGNLSELKDSVQAYAQLASTYPNDALAVDALLNAGKISAESLNDNAAAKRFYNQLLLRSGEHSDTAATATLKLGRLALDAKDGKTAQLLLQRVLRQWPRLSDRGAEAQFYLGITYETLFKNKEWATRAYDATIARYPASTWANDARERLGLIVFSDTRGHRPARRVLIEIKPLPDDGAADGSLWAALRLVLAARGIEADDVTLRGWSLAPFYAGFDPQNPSHVVDPPFDVFENVVANAGLQFTVKSGGKPDEALRDLQDEIDSARPPLVYYEDSQGQGSWALCIGYDSDRGEVMLQGHGARFDTISAKTFADMWKAKSDFGQPFTMLTFTTPGVKAEPAPSLTPTPEPSPKPGTTPMPDLMTSPAFVWQLPVLSAKNAQQRALNRGAQLVARPRAGDVLLNAEALDMLASQLNSLAHAKESAEKTETPDVVPTPEASPTDSGTPASGATPEGTSESPYAPTATPVATSVPLSHEDTSARIKTVLGFFGAPARQWANRRREAAAWCNEAANKLNNPKLKTAATDWRASSAALEAAIMLVPSHLEEPLGAGDRAQLGEVAREVEKARDAERDAAREMGG